MKRQILSATLALTMVSSSFTGVFAAGAETKKPFKGINGDMVASGNIFSDEKDTAAASPLIKKFKADLKENKFKDEKVVYFVEYKTKNDKDKVLTAIKKLPNTKLLYEYDIIFQGCSVETDMDNLDALKLIDGVKSVERSQKIEPLMENVRKEIKVNEASDYLKSIKGNSPAIASNYDGRGMLISHIDTGMDASHKAMRIDDDAKAMMKIKNNRKDPFWVNDKVPRAFNYMNGGNNTIEKYDDGSPYHDPHGMHIAGILAANDTKEDVQNHKGIRGVAPNAQILSYKMYSDSSNAFAGDETMFHAFEDSIKQGADVVSISSGFTGTGLVGEKYWPAIRAMREKGIPVFVATGNFATSASNSSWDVYPNNALGMTDTGNVTRTAAHEDAIAVGSSRNTVVQFPGVKIGKTSESAKAFRYSQIGAFFDKSKIPAGKYSFVYLGKCQDEDIAGKDLEGKIVVMDRIYTGDLKYAFKKVQDKGAIAVVVVNTVSYYNRDDWAKVPAMGYERDEKTTMNVISLSGEDGAVLWDMMTSKVASRSAGDLYKDMAAYNGRKPKLGEEASLDLSFLDTPIEWKDQSIPAGSTSWGPRNDLMLKPDLSAPGKNIYSTLNKINGVDDYAYLSGTSMSTPVAAGASVIIRPKLKEMVNSPVLKAANIDLTSLTKIVMQNTSGPMIDPSTATTAEKALFASPRQQGAGLINVERALKTGVTASYQVKDSTGAYNAYGAVSLKEIKGGAKDFTVDLHNTTDQPKTFVVTASPVTTDGEKKVTKLDEEYKDEQHKEGKQVVAEIHPEKVDGAEVTFKNLNGEKEITVPARSSIKLEASLKTGTAADADKFVESFISFESKDPKQSSLSMPVMGFAGDWNKEPIIDKWAWEEGSKSGKIIVFDDEGKPKRPGTLNYGRGGEHGVDMFHPAGVIQNTADGNPNYEQDPALFALNTKMAVDKGGQQSDSSLLKNKKKEDYEINNAGLTPDPLVLRSASDAKMYIESENGKNLRTMGVQHFVRGILNSRRNTARGLKSALKKVWGDFKWDGTIFNPQYDDGHGGTLSGLDQMAEGQYYYTFKYRLTPDYDWQQSKIPIRIDNTAPTLASVDFSNPDQIQLTAKDTYHKPKDKNKTYFLRDQEKNPQAFDEVASKVWYVGAGFVDEEGNLEKELKVLRTGKDGEYTIEGANDNLAGKTIEIIVLDGAGNYSKVRRYQFDKTLTEGKLNYQVLERTMVKEAEGFNPAEFEFKPVKGEAGKGSIDSSKLKNPPAKQEDHAKKDVPVLEGDAKLVLTNESKALVDLEQKDMNKRVKPRKTTQQDFINGGTKEIIDVGENCNELDEDGFPKYYDGLDENDEPIPIDFEYETKEELKKDGLEKKIALNTNGGFRLTGVLENVTKDAKLYFSSTGMRKTTDKKEIPTYGYDEKTHTMQFDFYGNRDDSGVEGVRFDYNGDLHLYVLDGKKKSNIIKVRMPKKEKKASGKDPLITNDDHKGYSSTLKNIEEFKADDLGSKIVTARDEAGREFFNLKDDIKINKGYALRIISYNAGKRGTEALSNNDYFADPKTLGDKQETKQTVNIGILQGFNVIRFELHKPKLAADGSFVKNSAGKVELNGDTMIFEKGRCIYFDKDVFQLDMDPDTFNPWVPQSGDIADPILYTKSSPMTLRGRIGDKGGFMWHLRINHHIIDEYLIYGDLNVDNSRPFSFTTEVKNGDVLDWGAKDYSGNGMPEKEFDTGVKRSMPDKFKIYIDNAKPEIAATTDSVDDTEHSVKYTLEGGDKKLHIKIEDFINAEKKIHGKLQEKSVMVNGKVYTEGKSLPTPTKNDPWTIDVVAADYARNRSVKQFTFDGEKVVEVAIKKATIHFDVEGINDLTVTLGEDCTLPMGDKIKAPEGKVFDGWLVQGVKKQPGYTFAVQRDLTITPIFKDVEKLPSYTLSFDLNGSASQKASVKIKKGDSYVLPEGKDIEPPKGKVFVGWEINGKVASPLTSIKINGDMTIKAVFKDAPATPDTPTPAPKPTPDKKDDGYIAVVPKGPSTTSQIDKPQQKEDQKQSATTPLFKDVLESHWAYKAVAYVVDKGYFKGLGEGIFQPNRGITRGEFVTVLGRIAKIDTEAYKNVAFTDVEADAFYAAYVNWASAEGLVKGIGEGKFQPNRKITREEMCVVMNHFLKRQNKTLQEKENASFKDDAQISDWAKESVKAMAKAGLVKGMEDGRFSPKTDFTRAQVAQVLYNMDKN